MKLYYTPSACSLVVRIILNELNLPFNEESVDLKTKKTVKGIDYLTINSKGAVPALELDTGEVLTENQVILQYLADMTPGQKVLASVKDINRYRTLEWLNYISTELHKGFGPLFNPGVPQEVISQQFIPKLKDRFAFLNKHLADNTYIMGDKFSLPDAYLFVMTRWANNFKIDLSNLSHLNKWIEIIKTHPSVVKSLQQEQ
ncbi:MAG: glutathione transferase GstA [Legionella sp.]|nr:glutathione transferase GstA [Legionella sp.]